MRPQDSSSCSPAWNVFSPTRFPSFESPLGFFLIQETLRAQLRCLPALPEVWEATDTPPTAARDAGGGALITSH